MRLKILIVPFFSVMILILGIGYIQPEIGTIGETKTALVTKEEQVANMDAVISNIDSLNTVLDAKKESEQFVLRYLPQERDQSRIIDALNFTAARSGVLISAMELKEVVREVPLDPMLASAGAPGSDAGAPTTSRFVATKAYSVKAMVRGSYENIKGFFDHVDRMDRFYKLNLFSIAVDKEANAAAVTGSAPGALLGVFQADFDYMSLKPTDTPIDIPVFQRPTWDLSMTEKALGRTTDPVPLPEKAQPGRPNPFQ